MEKKKNIISDSHLEKYRNTTEAALKIAKKNINKEKEKQALEIIKMVEAYLSDSLYFKEKNNYVNSFAAINYAHGWLDTGSRLGIFDVSDDKLFVIQ